MGAILVPIFIYISQVLANDFLQASFFYRNSQNVIWKLKRLPPAKQILNFAYSKGVNAHNSRLPALSHFYQDVLAALRAQGAYTTHLDELSVPGTDLMVNKAWEVLQDAQQFYQDGARSRIPSKVLNQHPEIFLWGAHEPLLDLVENYIQLPVYYLGAELKKEVANNSLEGVRHWHIDKEDRRMVKVIIYLDDVDAQGGPFEYIQKTLSQTTARALNYSSGFVADDLMSNYMPPEYWHTCVGSKHSAFIVDTSSVFHRAKPPANRDRYSITYHYISQFPLMTYEKIYFGDCQILSPHLSARQKQCLRQRSHAQGSRPRSDAQTQPV